MHVYFDESKISNEDMFVCDNDDVLELNTNNITKDDKID